MSDTTGKLPHSLHLLSLAELLLQSLPLGQVAGDPLYPCGLPILE